MEDVNTNFQAPSWVNWHLTIMNLVPECSSAVCDPPHWLLHPRGMLKEPCLLEKEHNPVLRQGGLPGSTWKDLNPSAYRCAQMYQDTETNAKRILNKEKINYQLTYTKNAPHMVWLYMAINCHNINWKKQEAWRQKKGERVFTFVHVTPHWQF